MDFTIWENHPENFEHQANRGQLTKLHGSIDWSRNNNLVYVGNPLFTGDESRHLLIYPGYKDKKGRSIGWPFNVFQDYFENAVSSASVFVFIGFAFRDEAINKIVSAKATKGSLIYIINPALDKSILPFSKQKVTIINKPFNIDAVQELSSNLLNNED